MRYLSEETENVIFEAVSACCAKLDQLAPNQFDQGPINTALASKLERTIRDHIEDYQTKE